MKVGRESPEELRERVKKIIKLLREHYPHSRTTLHYETPFQLLVATILAAQCTDEKVNQITPLLFKKYPTIADLARASQAEVEAIIRPTGFFRNKARNIIAAARSIMEEFGGEVPDRMEELIKLPGVARKTANIVLSSAFRHPNKIEQDLMAIVPREDWLDFNYLLVDHGRAVCQARHPLCNECFLRSLCPAAAEMAAEKTGEQK